MGKNFNIDKLILKDEYLNLPVGEKRRAILAGKLSVLLALISFFYFNLEFKGFIDTGLIIYIIAFFIGIFLFFMNRAGYFLTSKIILLSVSYMTIFLLGTSNIQNTHSYVYYIPLLFTTFAFFRYRRLHISLIFTFISLILFSIDYFTEFSIMPRQALAENEIVIFTFSNYFIGMLITTYLGYFITITNYYSEKELLDRQRELNRITQELKENKQRYELAITGTNAGVWDWDILNDTIYHGTKWKEMLGYREDEVVDINIEKFYSMIHPSDADYVKRAVQNHLKKGETFNIEYRIRKKDGSYHWYLDSGKAVIDKENKPVRMVGSIIDVTERKKAEEKIKKQKDLLEKANTELDRFVYITSHDLKAPLLSIQGLINLAEISDKKEEIRHCLNLMKDRVKGLETFISDIIDYSRNVRSGVVKEEFALKPFFRKIVDELSYMENVDKLNFVIDTDEDLSIITDEKRLSVVMKNLVFNAIKYHDYDQERPEIIIKASNTPDNVRISVKDNGEGIKEEMLSKIFDMFYRASEKSSGSGLGLYIVKEMVAKLHGKVEVQSEYGKGSEFILYLPKTY